MQRPCRGGARDRNEDRLDHEAVPDVTVRMVPQLVGQDDFDFVVGIMRQQGVREQDAAAPARTDERRIGAPRLLTQAPLVHAEDGHARTLRERFDPRSQRRPVERLEAVEERQEHDRRQACEPDDGEGAGSGSRRPPPARPARERHVHELRRGQNENDAHPEPFELVDEPHPQGDVRQAVAALEHKGLVEALR